MNILNLLKDYGGKWQIKGEAEHLTAAEQAQVASITVVPSNYGASACLLMKNGNTKYIPLSQDASYGIGETINVEDLQVVTLTKDGRDIYRAL